MKSDVFKVLLDNLKPIYFPNEQDIDRELFFPLFSNANACDCMTGYFTSGALRELAYSIAYFLQKDSGKIRFLISPNLTEEDNAALKKAILIDEDVLERLFPNFSVDEKTLRRKTIESLCYLVARNKIEIKIAIQNAGLFHTKAWLFDTVHGNISVHGSSNATGSGLTKNFEQLTVSKDTDLNGQEVITALKNRFSEIWDGTYKGIYTADLNITTLHNIHSINKQIEDSFRPNDLYDDFIKVSELEANNIAKKRVPVLKIPDWLDYQSGDYAHQGEAIDAWFNNNKNGILSIATGGGKTLTALTAAALLNKEMEKILVVITVPTTVLVSQWVVDVEKFGITALVNSPGSKQSVYREINNLVRNIKVGTCSSGVLLVTHDFFKSEKLLELLNKAGKKVPLLLIADEVHNLGSTGFRSCAPTFFDYKLGLSATVIRQFDDVGTNFLLDYFDGIVYEYGLDKAIGKCLVEYYYYVHQVYLLEHELDEWLSLTIDINRLSYAAELADGAAEKERWKRLCLKRRKIIEGAVSKVYKLKEVLPDENHNIKRSLIFCTDKKPEQLEAVNELLNDRRVLFHQVTQEETKNKKKLSSIIKSFSNEDIAVLTSKRVLDEGFNVPQTETAYLLASNTVERQWIQRLGRILRKSENTGKVYAHIHDFVVMPQERDDGQIDSDLKSLMKGEINRVKFFNELSLNGLEENGAFDIIENIYDYLEAT